MVAVLKPVAQSNVVDAVFDEIMSHILSGEWRIGEKIPSENELTAKLNVSRNSLRQALGRFNALGIIESRQGDGSYVKAIDLTFYMKNIFPMVVLSRYDALNLYQLQRALHDEAAHCAARLATDEQIAQMSVEFEKMKHFHALGDQMNYLYADMRFHEIFIEMTRNPILISIEYCISKIMQGPLYEVAYGGIREESILEHGKVLAALQERDSRGVVSWMSAHMNDVVSRLEKKAAADKQASCSQEGA